MGALAAVGLALNPSLTALGDTAHSLCDSNPPTIVGTAQDDVLRGTSHRDVITARGGNDVIRGRGGNDIICGNRGTDRILAGTGDDRAVGGRGEDDIEGGPGADTLQGRKGNDDLQGGAGKDRLRGGLGNSDRADGGPGADRCQAEIEISCNAPPKANADSYDVDEDGVLNEVAPGVLANDSDADNDSLTATQASGPSDGDLTLEPDGSFTYEPDPNFAGSDSFTYRANDGSEESAPATVTIDVAAINDQPTDITLGDNSIDENEPSGTAVGTFTVDDPDSGDTQTLTLVSGTGDTDNARFTIDNAVLKTAEVFNFENQGPFSIRVRTTDSGNLQREEEFTINIADVNEAPTNITLDDNSIDENSPSGTAVGTFSVDDPDAGDTNTLSLVSGTGATDNARFTIDNGVLKTAEVFDFETQGPFSIRVRTSDSGNLQREEQFTVNVADVNDAPTVNTSGGSTSYTEGDPATTIDGSLTVGDPDDTNLEGGQVRISNNFQSGDDLVFVNQNGISGVYNPGTGVLTLTGTASVADYQTALRSIQFQNTNDNSSSPKTIEFKVNDGDADSNLATKNLAVTGSNDAPTVDLNGEANPGINTTVDFNEVVAGGGNPTTVAPNTDTSDPDDTNLESALVTLTNEQNIGEESLSVDQSLATTNGIAVTIAANGDQITLTGSATKQAYEDVLRTVKYDNDALVLTPTPDRVIEFKVNDGDADSPVATATVEVIPLNSAPTLDLNGGGAGENEAVTFTEDGGAVQLAPNATTTDSDDTHYSQATITLTNQQDGASEVLNVSNAGAPCVNVTNNSSHAITLSGNCTSGDYQTVIRTATYNNTSNTPTTSPSRSVEFKVNDGTDDSPTRTSTVTVQATNDPPVNTVPGGQTLNEDGSKTFSSGNGNQISINDPDAGSNAVKVTLTVTNGRLTLNGTTGLSFACGTCAGDGTSDQTMTFTGSQSDINAALNGLIYTPNSNYNGADTLTITTDDQGNTGGPAQQDTDDIGLTITAVNDGPTNTVPGAQSVDEDQPLIFSSGNGNAVSIADPDSGASDVRVTLGVSNNGRLTLATVSGLNFGCAGCSGDGVNDASMVFEGTVAEVNAALNGMTYQGVQDFNGNDTLSITTDDLGNTGSGGALSDGPDTVAITVNPVNDAPVADNETFGGAGEGNDQAHGNTTMQVDDPSDNKSAPTHPHTEIAGDILAGDSDADGPGPLIVQSAGSDAGATNGQTADGGQVSIESDGDFVYFPPASVSCDNGTDSFKYRISDQANSGAGPIPGTAIGTVTIHLEGCVWYVHNNASGNAGTSSQPFDTLAQAETASGANHTVFVFDGDNTSTGYATGYAMNAGERLIGEHEGLTVDPDQGGSLTADSLHPANAGAHPTLTATNEDVVELDDGNEVRGFNLDPAGTGSGIAGAAGDTGGGTIDDLNVIDTGVAGQQPGLELDSTTGTFNISNLVVNNSAATSPPNTATGVRVNSAGTVNFNPTGQTSITITGAKGLDATGTNMGSGSTFDDITVTGSSVGGVNLLNTTGTTTFGDGTGTDLSLTTTSGSAPAFGVNNGGTINVAAAGADDVHATGGPAIDVVGTSGALLEFDDVDSTNSAGDGINLDGLGTGTFSSSSGDIGGATGISFDLNGGSGNITYPGNFGNGSGTTAIDITGRSGGTVSLTGPISDTSDAGGGLNVASNSGGATTLNNATKQFNTGDTWAVTFMNSGGHTLNLFAGGLDIDTTTGVGVAAATSGTLAITGTGNTIDSGTGPALDVRSTDIAVAGLTFRSISANGAQQGIVLSSTGSSGHLTVTGNGGTCTNANTSGCSGGEIENGWGTDASIATPAGTGIVLNNTTAPSFTRMWIHDHSNYGIRGTSVNGFTLDNSVINGTNGTNASGTFEDSSIYFDNNSGPALTGSASITNTHVQGGFTNNIWVQQHAGSLNRLTMDNITVGPNGTASGNQGVMVEGLGTSTTNVTLQNSTLTSSRGMVSQFIGNGTGGGDLDVYNNDFSNNHPQEDSASGLLGINGGAAGTFTIDVGNGGTAGNHNTFQSASGTAVNIIKTNGSGTLTGTFSANTIGVDDPSDNSGSLNGSGLQFIHAGGGGTGTLNITNNTVREYNNDGITLRASAGGVADTGTMNVNVTGNTVTDPGSNPSAIGFNGIRLTAGVLSGDDFDVCAHIKSNSIVGSATDPVDNPGQPDMFAWARFNSTIRLPGYGGGATDTTAVASFLKNQNDNNPNSAALEAPAPTVDALASNSGTFTGTGTGCP